MTEEAIRTYWPESSGQGFIRSAELADDEIELTWGALNAPSSVSQLSVQEIREEVTPDMPNPASVVALRDRDSIVLIFREDKETEFAKARENDGDIFQHGILTSEGYKTY